MNDTKEENSNEVKRERDEALSRLKSSERKVYTLSIVICIVAFGFTVAFSTRQAECHDNLGATKDKIKDLQKANEHCMTDLSKCNSNLYDTKQEIQTNEQCMIELSKCDKSLSDIKQELKSNQDIIQQYIDDLMNTQNSLAEYKNKKCIEEEEYDMINNKLEACTNDLNKSASKNSKGGNNEKQSSKTERKLKKCQTCQIDTENINNHGVHVLKGRVLQVVHVDRPWRTARKDCQERGGDLFVPRNVDKLAEYLLEKEPDSHHFWIGISDLENAEEFKGVNGGNVVGGWEEQNQIHRAQNPKTKNPGSDCVSLIYADQTKGLAATHCDAGMHYICDLAPATTHDIFN